MCLNRLNVSREHREHRGRRGAGGGGAAAVRARHVRVHAGAPARHRHGPGGQGARHRRLRTTHLPLWRLSRGQFALPTARVLTFNPDHI